MMIRSALTAIAGVLIVCSAEAAPLKSDSKVKATANAGKQGQDGKQTIEVVLAIDKGWHLYANPTPTYSESQVVVTGSQNGKAIDAKIDYPEGKLVKDSAGDYRSYEGTVTIKVTVDRAKLGSGPIDLIVKVSACDKDSCLLPGDIKLTVP